MAMVRVSSDFPAFTADFPLLLEHALRPGVRWSVNVAQRFRLLLNFGHSSGILPRPMTDQEETHLAEEIQNAKAASPEPEIRGLTVRAALLEFAERHGVAGEILREL